MKGLVLKDLLLMIKMNKKIIIVMYCFVLAIAFLGENEVYAIMSSTFLSLFIGMHLMMTMTYDGMSFWKQYELTLPMNKYQIIASKYVTCLCLIPIGLVGISIIYISRWVVYHSFSLNQFAFSAVTAMLLPILWCSICLAIAQWFGYMMVQYVRMGCTFLVIFLLNKMPYDIGLLVKNMSLNPILIVISVFGVIVMSYFISVMGYARKK